MKHVIEIGEPNIGHHTTVLANVRTMWLCRYFAPWSFFLLYYSYIYGKFFFRAIKYFWVCIKK